MRLKKMHWFGIVFAGITVVIAGIFYLNGEDINLFLFLIGIAFTIVALPFVAGLVIENKKEQEVNEMFLEFSRNDVGSQVIRRAVSLISEAEKAGGEIDYILESVAKSIAEIEKLKKERRAAIYNLVVQGYIIFFIFIGIMLVMQFKILPLTQGIGSFNLLGGNIANIANAQVEESAGPDLESLGRSFLYLLLTQGFFAGLTIGKLAEGSIKAGVKHSFILMIAAFLISSGAKLLLG